MENKTTKILFIHHSTGANLIKEGKIRQLLKDIDPSVEFWDHSYNLSKTLPTILAKLLYQTGLSDNNGLITGTDYNIVLSNNSPKEYAEIFSRNSEDYTLKAILQYDIIAFKNCFPTTEIKSDQQLEEDKKYYEAIKKSVAKYPAKKFILMTPPPLRTECTKKEYSARAKKLVVWLTSKEYLVGASNLFVFDLFGLWVDENGVLKKEYCRLIPLDSHPNSKANREVAPVFIKFITKVAFN